MAHVVDLFPGSAHASVLGGAPEDRAIWDFAATEGFAVVTKDSDFYRMSVAWGAPPKVIWLRIGNAGSRAVVDMLRANAAAIEAFDGDAQSALLIFEAGSP